MIKTKTFKGTWLNRAGEVYSILLDGSSNTGLRVNVHRWIDDNTYDFELMKGDGRHVSSQSFEKSELKNPSPEQIESEIERLIQKSGTDAQ